MIRLLEGDVRAKLAELPADSVHCIVTSVPYWGLRAYGTEPQVWPAFAEASAGAGGAEGCAHEWGDDSKSGQRLRNGQGGSLGGGDGPETLHPSIGRFCTRCNAWRGEHGQEPTPQLYVAHEVEIWRALRRVLRPDGIAWLNIGDTYAGGGNGGGGSFAKGLPGQTAHGDKNKPSRGGDRGVNGGLKPKDLALIPERLAIALQDDGWWIRSRVPWVKRSAMPDSTTDRPGVAVEYFWKLTKSGTTKFWTHRDLAGTRRRPAADYRWWDKAIEQESEHEPRNWRTALLPGGRPDEKRWSRVNLWRGHDYFWDAAAVRQAVAPSTVTRLSQDIDHQAGSRRANGGSRDDRPLRAAGDVSGRNFRDADLLFASLAPPHGLISAPSFDEGSGATPLALDVNTAGYAEAHFATFPTKLIEPLIKASTSERGCCAGCGAPWVRVTEVHQVKVAASGHNVRGDARRQPDTRTDLTTARTRRVDTTLDWRPSCACHEPGWPPLVVPCTVLDPFGGSGTTGLVADRLGRDAILIELQTNYAAMARDRITDDAPLFAELVAG